MVDSKVISVYVKTSWREYRGKRYYQYHLAEAYRDPETGKARQRLLMNLSKLPDHVIEGIRQSLKTGKPTPGCAVDIHTGDTLRGAGLLAIYRAWKEYGLEDILANFTDAERESIFAMVAQRILKPCSKLALKRQFADTLFAALFSAKRLDEDELYRVMDVLHQDFYGVQERLRRREASPVLCLFDITSTYFEGTHADDGAYGHSRDKRWDRYQIVIGLVCDEKGVPLALEVWPGNTGDSCTVIDRIRALRDQFGIEKAVFVADSGMYSEANIEAIERHGFDHILHVDWQTQRKQLEQMGPVQLELFDEQGVVEWQHDGVRYVGCHSEQKQQRAASRRERGMQKAEEELRQLARTASKGRYYSWTRMREKTNDILTAAGVADLWQIEISYLDEEPSSPDEKARLRLTFTPDEEAIARTQAVEGKYVLRTSLPSESCPAEQAEKHYRCLQLVERAFRHIKSYLRIRPIYHYRRRRIRAHVLICFLAFYLVKCMELELREQGITEEVERLLEKWDTLRLVNLRLDFGEHSREEWNWSLGDIGKDIQADIEAVGWWRSIDAHRRRLVSSLVQDG